MRALTSSSFANLGEENQFPRYEQAEIYDDKGYVVIWLVIPKGIVGIVGIGDIVGCVDCEVLAS